MTSPNIIYHTGVSMSRLKRLTSARVFHEFRNLMKRAKPLQPERHSSALDRQLFKSIHDPAMLKALLLRGADANARDEMQNTPLIIAALHGNRIACEILIDHGADVNAKSNDQTTPILAASDNDHSELFGYLLEKGAKLENPKIPR